MARLAVLVPKPRVNLTRFHEVHPCTSPLRGSLRLCKSAILPICHGVFAPNSQKGTLQQYAGRLHREHAPKTDVRIIDFVDTGHPALLRMWDKRQSGYRAMGYRMAEQSNPH